MDDTFFGHGVINNNINLNDYLQSHSSYGNILKKPFINNLYFCIKNEQYEIIVMWGLIVVTIIVFILLVIKDNEDEAETEFSL